MQLDDGFHDLISITTPHGEMIFPANDEIIGKSMLLYGEWAGLELESLSRFISVGDTVLDVGGCYGTHAIAFAQMVGPEGRVMTFEASDKNFDILCRNVTAYCGPPVIESRLAIVSASVEDIFELEQNNTNAGASQLVAAHSISLDTRRSGIALDELTFSKVDFVKIDVEGMEESVLRGAQALIGKFRPVVFFEVNSISGAMASISAFQDNDYVFFGLVSPAFNSNNRFANSENIFNDATECGIFAFPKCRLSQIKMTVTEIKLSQIGSADDVALLLLHKPQYFQEILAKTPASKTLEVPICATYLHDVLAKKKVLEMERERVQVLFDRLEVMGGLIQKPISTSLQRNLAKAVLNNIPWLSEHWRTKLQHSVDKREYRHLFGDRDNFLTVNSVEGSEKH